MQAWQRIDEGTDVTKAGFRTITHKKFRMNNGRVMSADIGGTPESSAAAVVALTKDNQVIIARQFRCGPEKIMDEMPGGIVDAGESAEQAVLRELREEVGYDSDDVEFVGSAYVNGWDNTIHHYFIAYNCTKIESSNPEDDEEIEVDLITIDKFIENAKQSRMTDAQGVLLAYDKLVGIKGGL